ncbi:MAG TPA: hypothetical protein DCL76_08795 [Chloroflexi bacterium]|nr:hypothetical protein [Chloroflexota bacterium]HCU97867.1 hypothetical protein [Chloroflexota bacterium]
MKHEIYLLDIDNVLIAPIGYRESFAFSINYILHNIGWSDTESHDGVAEIFEAYGITNEWDMVAICLASLFVSVSDCIGDKSLPSDPKHALSFISNLDVPKQALDFICLAREVGKMYMKGNDSILPTVVAFELLVSVDNDSLNSLIKNVLLNYRDINKSLTMQIFQNYAVGSRNFTKTYGFESLFEQVSLLSEKDEPLLSFYNAERLIYLAKQNIINPVIFTARPSLPPKGVDDDANHYSPEAELAVQLLGLDELPMIGSGRTDWLAFNTGGDPSDYIKPNPVHALAAIGAAISHDEENSLMAAYELVLSGQLLHPLSLLIDSTVNVTVFEDSARNIESVKNSVKLLEMYGIQCVFSAVGIGIHEEKRSVLKKSGARVFTNINDALTL